MINKTETGPDPKDTPETAAGEEEIARLINQAAGDPGLNRPFMEPKGAGPKRGRGRPKKENPSVETPQSPGPGTPGADGAQPGETPPDASAEIKLACRGIFGAASGALVRYTGTPRVALQDAEIAALGDTWGAVVNRYLPDLAKTHVELIAALTVTTMVGIRIRAVLIDEIEKKKASQAKEFKQPTVVPGQ